MRRLIAFDNVSLDGYFSGPHGDIGWAHRPDPDGEWSAFVAGNASGGGTLLLGRVTYELMASYWPTPLAAQNDPVVARRMNELPKVVVSRTLRQAAWSNTELLQGDLATEVRRLKERAGPGIAILGSGSLIAQLAPTGLIDEYQVVVHPVVLGAGRALFEGVPGPLGLERTQTRAFSNGNVLLCYAPAPRA